MGIRFHCHACTKRLNVKGFLAGKRGICPHCGTKVEIPWQSQGKEERGSEESAPAAATAVPQSVAVGAVNGNSPATIPTSTSNGNATAADQPAAGTVRAIPVGPAQPTGLPAVPYGQATAANPAAPSAAPASTSASAPASAPPVPQAAPAAPAAAPDPIAEVPGAVWYVRPPSGGQYGPASGEIMRKWIGEGRVSADSLIWRDGWADWQNAAQLFPELGTGPNAAPATAPSAPAYGSGSPAVSADPAPPGRTYPRRKNNNSLAVVIVVLLTLLSLGLGAALFAAIQLGS